MKTGFIEIEDGGNNISQSFTAPSDRDVADIVLSTIGATIGTPEEVPETESLYYKVIYQGDVVTDDGKHVHARVWISTE